MRKGDVVLLSDEWTVIRRLGGGAFGKVFEVESSGTRGALKVIPKAPGADRELLFVDLGDARNVVPILDRGETRASWLLLMPIAKPTLREHLTDSGGSLVESDAVTVITDIATALADLDGRVVHRDLKPENVLMMDGVWCVADFGISRYAEATTTPDTHKYSMTPPYASPEQWRFEHATNAADIYALGVISYELLSGTRPFAGPRQDDFRQQHLHDTAPPAPGSPALAALIGECLYKASGARPTPANVLARLERLTPAPTLAGVAALQQANQQEVRQRSEQHAAKSEAQTQAALRADLYEAARSQFAAISAELRDLLASAATEAEVIRQRGDGWTLHLGKADLRLSPIAKTAPNPWGGWDSPAFSVIAHSTLSLKVPETRYGYQGRSHSLWYGDVKDDGAFGWFETAFMDMPLMTGRRLAHKPSALDPGEPSAKAVWNGMAEYQVAWPFTPLNLGVLDDFLGRWAGWLAAAHAGALSTPGTMPELPTDGSWRRS